MSPAGYRTAAHGWETYASTGFLATDPGNRAHAGGRRAPGFRAAPHAEWTGARPRSGRGASPSSRAGTDSARPVQGAGWLRGHAVGSDAAAAQPDEHGHRS